MDLREKLIELLKDCVYENVELDDGYVGFDVNCEKIADHLIANGVTVQEWIPVTERLPDVGSIVLVSDNETDCHVWQYTNYSERGVQMPWTDEFGIPCKTEEITHWMPLPEPPKGD